MRILIAEDEKSLNRIISKQLKSAGYSVDCCFDGEEAYDMISMTEYDAAVFDVMMPKIDGFSLLKRIRNEGNDLPVLFLTARDSIEDRVEGLDIGADDYLVKPFTYERFQMALEKFMAQNHALKDTETFDQSNIDYLIDNARKKTESVFPKGIQEKTLLLIIDYLKENKGKWLTGDEISERISLTSVTVRRYMNYLSESGKVIAQINYETGGRPCMKYKITPE